MKYTQHSPRDFVSVALLALTIVASYFFVSGFNQPGMYFSIMTQAAIVGILALGMLFVLVCGDIDLSIGGQSTLYSILCAYFLKNLSMPLLAAIVLTLLAAALTGLLIGWGIDCLTLNPMVATIAAAVTFSGLANIISRGFPIFNLPESLLALSRLTLGMLSVPAALFALLTLLTVFILRYTYWGKFFYAIGSNAAASEKAGVPVRRARMYAYMLCSVFCAVAAIAFVGRVGTATLSMGDSYVLDVLTIAALAGVGFSGGRGNVLPIVCSAFLLTTLTSAFSALQVAFFYQDLLKGAILFFAISTKSRKP